MSFERLTAFAVGPHEVGCTCAEVSDVDLAATHAASHGSFQRLVACACVRACVHSVGFNSPWRAYMRMCSV